MRISLLALPLILLAPLTANAGVVVVANYTAEPISFTVAEPKAKPRSHTLPANTVAPVYITGSADLTFRSAGRDTTLRLDLYNAYMFLPDRAAGVKLEGIELPGEALHRDGRPELNPVPLDPPVSLPVTLLVDDADPRADLLWKKEVRARFDEAAQVIEKTCGIRLEVAGFAVWKSDPDATSTTELLKSLEDAVKVKPGALAVGFSSRRLNEKVDDKFGMDRGLNGRHILLRENRPRNEPERVEVLLQFLARALGAVTSPDPGSAMRAKLADGYVLRAGSVLRLDPLNVLALNLWANERRGNPGVTLATLSPANRHRLTRVYKALREASPGDLHAAGYLDELDRIAAKEPKAKDTSQPIGRESIPEEAVRKILNAITERAKQNAALGSAALTGDELTTAYIRAAAETAVKHPGSDMVPAFLIALGIALDDTHALSLDLLTGDVVKELETDAERKARLAVLGNPTLGGRRDFCRRYFIGCATGVLLAPATAEQAAIARAASDLQQPTGLCFPTIASEFAGITFARVARADPELVRDVIATFNAIDYLPPLGGLRNGFSAEKFAEVYGETTDPRFTAILTDIRARLKAMPAYR